MNAPPPIWAITPELVYKNLTTTPQGLSDTEADLCLKQYGYNELPPSQTRSLILRFVDQLTHFMALLLWVAGILAVTMAIYYQASTATLAAIVACQDGNVFACRSERVSIFRFGFFTNRLIWLGIAVEWVLMLSIIYSPTLRKIFTTAPLQPWQWLTLLVCPLLVLMADELRKRFLKSQKAA